MISRSSSCAASSRWARALRLASDSSPAMDGSKIRPISATASRPKTANSRGRKSRLIRLLPGQLRGHAPALRRFAAIRSRDAFLCGRALARRRSRCAPSSQIPGRSMWRARASCAGRAAYKGRLRTPPAAHNPAPISVSCSACKAQAEIADRRRRASSTAARRSASAVPSGRAVAIRGGAPSCRRCAQARWLLPCSVTANSIAHRLYPPSASSRLFLFCVARQST